MTTASAKTEAVAGECIRCNGTGRLPHFGHIVAGTCFGCSGTGRVTYRAKASTAAQAIPYTQERIISELRGWYSAGKSRTGSGRSGWALDAADDVTYRLALIEDAAKRSQIAASFAGLGVAVPRG